MGGIVFCFSIEDLKNSDKCCFTWFYLPDLRSLVTVSFWTSLPGTSLSAIHASYQVSVCQATILLSLLLAHTSRCKPWSRFVGSSVTIPLVDFLHRLTACPSYKKPEVGQTILQVYNWWAIRDSNPGPTGYEPVALDQLS